MTSVAQMPFQVKGLKTLSYVAALVAETSQPDAVMDACLNRVALDMGLSRLRIFLPDEKGELQIHYACGLSHAEIELESFQQGEGITGQVMISGQRAVIKNIHQHPEFCTKTRNREALTDNETIYLALPIVHKSQCIGVLATLASDSADDPVLLDLLQVVVTLVSQLLYTKKRLAREALPAAVPARPRQSVRSCRSTYGILGQSAALKKAMDKARRAAACGAPVMLTGESGSGKERFARMIHLASDRQEKPFVGLNCAALPENLLESELFGHEKGSFSGATSLRKGKFEFASGGTLFLDEIGEMSFNLQAKLLRVLQESVVERLGSNKSIATDVRIITATNRHLENAVNVCTFRMDLYFRLNVIRIQLPALRERGEDIRLLSNYFLLRENQRHGRNIVLDPAAWAVLEQFSWPGNVRQLENCITRLVVMAETELLREMDIHNFLSEESILEVHEQGEVGPQKTKIPPALQSQPGRPYSKVSNNEKESIQHALVLARGNKTAAAAQLGLTVRQLHYRMQKLAIN